MPKVKNYKPLRKVAATATLLAMAVFSFGAFTAFSASGLVLGLGLGFASSSVSAASNSSTINVNVSDGITIRVLDSTASSNLEELAFDFVPTDAGVSATKNAVVEVATSNETGYKLYVQSDWREDNTSSSGTYADSESTAAHTTSLIHFGATSIPAVTDKIPTNLGTSYPYWYYYNDYYSANKVIPAFGNPDLLAELSEPTDSDKTTVPITVGVDTSIVAGTYRNKLVFTAISNPLPVNYYLYFNGSAENVTNIPGTMSARVVASSKTFTIPDSVPKRYKYAFVGYSETPLEDNADTTGVTLYQPGDEVTISVAGVTGVEQIAEKTLYAAWRDAEKWQLFLDEGGYDYRAYETLDEAMADSSVYSSIFDNATAMSYLVANEDLIGEIKEAENYSATLVPELLGSSVYTDAEKYEYGLPFYVFNGGYTGTLSGISEEYTIHYPNTGCSHAHSVQVNTTVRVSNTACTYDCASSYAYFAQAVTLDKYARMGTYVSASSAMTVNSNYVQQMGMAPGSASVGGGRNTTITTLGKNYVNVNHDQAENVPYVGIGACFAPRTQYTSTVTISQWWFE